MSETTDLLWTINADVLAALARRLGARNTSTRKPDTIDALDQMIHGGVQRILDHLSDIEKKLLAEIAYGDGLVNTARFTAKYGVACPLPSGRRPSEASPLLLFIGDMYSLRELPASAATALRAAMPKPAPAIVATVD